MASQEVMRHNQTVLASLEEGDLVEFSRGGYSHWAVYIGNEEVIHLMTNRDKKAFNPAHLSSCCGRCSEKASVCIDKFVDVADKDKAKRNNKLDGKKKPKKKVTAEHFLPDCHIYRIARQHTLVSACQLQFYHPRPRSQIVQNALSRLDEVGYNVIFKNCEHFATWCRYGEASSDQVQFCSSVALGAAAGAVGVVGITAAVVSSRKTKKQTQ